MLGDVGCTLSLEKTYEAPDELAPIASASGTRCLTERLLDLPELPLAAVGAEPSLNGAAPSRGAMITEPRSTVLMDAQCRHHDDPSPSLAGTTATKLCNKQQEEKVPVIVESRRVSGQGRSDWCGAPKGLGRNNRNCMDPSSLCGESDDDEACTPGFSAWAANGDPQRPVMISSKRVIAHL